MVKTSITHKKYLTPELKDPDPVSAKSESQMLSLNLT